jgi:hypothetical protein
MEKIPFEERLERIMDQAEDWGDDVDEVAEALCQAQQRNLKRLEIGDAKDT